MRVIGITGKAGSGKDTIGKYLMEQHSLYPIAFADPIKHAIAAMLCTTVSALFEDREVKERVMPGLGKSPRQLAQTLGTEWGRIVNGEDWWIKLMKFRMDSMWGENLCLTSCTGFVVTDVRFDNEAEAIKSWGGKVIEVHRQGIAAVSAHASEAGVSTNLIDYPIFNDGSIDELHEKVDLLWEYIK